MKKLFIYSAVLLSLAFSFGCDKSSFPGAKVSPYFSMFDLRDLYKGNEVELSSETMGGSNQITGMVVSDYSGRNMPDGVLVVQDSRRLNKLRGISINLGADASKYTSGDSVIVNVDGGILKRVNGILEITGIHNSAVTKVSSNNAIPVNIVKTADVLANPGNYESTLAVIVKGGLNPLPTTQIVLNGNQRINDGFGDITVKTNANAAFKDSIVPVLGNYYGIVFDSLIGKDSLVPQFRPRTADDIAVLSSTITVTPAIITGFISDVKGADGNYEYMQFLATQDIDFSKTPFAVVVINNAGASIPTGYPVKGWATGGMRSFKFNLFQGKATKGTFFYVGGAGKEINGTGSTNMSTSNWIRSFDYTMQGGDGFGNATSGLFANSGNASGIAIFSDSAVDVNSVPIDAVFIGGGGSLYVPATDESQAMGYLIPNNDFYDQKNPITLASQPYYEAGSNMLFFGYLTKDLGYFNMLGGVYNTELGRWTTARSQNPLLLTTASPIDTIEGEGATIIK